jgi:leucine-rich repeat protein SHOC2
MRMVRQYTLCGETLGAEIWISSRPRVVFRDGFFFSARCGFDEVISIAIVDKGLREIPESVQLLSNIQTMYLSNNNIKSLPLSILSLSSLQLINLEGNPVDISLDWSHKHLTQFPHLILKLLRNLKNLDLSFNDLTKIGMGISVSSTSLQYLNLSSNSFHDFPLDSQSSLPSLKSLDLSRNEVKALPNFVFQSFFVHSLNLSYNLIESVSYLWALWSTPSTGRSLYLKGNPISSLHWEYSAKIQPRLVSFPLNFDLISQQIVFLNLSGQNPGYGKLPEEIGLLVNLQVLDLSNTAVALFSNNFCNLTRLEYLDLTANDLGQFQNLNLSEATINCLPNMTSLKVFNASLSQRSHFFDKASIRIQDIRNLEVLNLSRILQYIDPQPWIVARFIAFERL